MATEQDTIEQQAAAFQQVFEEALRLKGKAQRALISIRATDGAWRQSHRSSKATEWTSWLGRTRVSRDESCVCGEGAGRSSSTMARSSRTSASTSSSRLRCLHSSSSSLTLARYSLRFVT